MSKILGLSQVGDSLQIGTDGPVLSNNNGNFKGFSKYYLSPASNMPRGHYEGRTLAYEL